MLYVSRKGRQQKRKVRKSNYTLFAFSLRVIVLCVLCVKPTDKLMTIVPLAVHSWHRGYSFVQL